MDIRTVGLLGAIAGAATIVTAQAAPATPNESAPSLAPSSYTELLGPVADPVAQLKAQDAALREQDGRGPASEDARSRDVGSVDDYYHRRHHHHHHQQRRSEHSHYRRHGYPPRHHHHHHHHNHARVGISVSG